MPGNTAWGKPSRFDNRNGTAAEAGSAAHTNIEYVCTHEVNSSQPQDPQGCLNAQSPGNAALSNTSLSDRIGPLLSL